MVSKDKDPARVRAGKIAARARWGDLRVVRLDQVDADTARLIRALVNNGAESGSKVAPE